MITANPSAIRCSKHAFPLLVLFGCVIALGFNTLLWSTNPLSHHVEGLLVVWAGFLGVFFLCKTHWHCKDPHVITSRQPKFLFWAIVLFFALVFRVQVLLAFPFLADDYQRYLFDGKLILAGINPYAVQPLAFPELGGATIPKPDIKTIYPPLAEGLFTVAAWLGGTLWHWRLMNLVPDLLGAVVFYRLLRRHRLPGHWIVLWLWNPLILKEGLHAAHLDIWTLLTLLLFVYGAQQGRLKVAALSLAAAVLLKLIPLVLLPVWLTQLSSHRERLIALGVVSSVITVGFAWFLPWHPFVNLAVFLQHIQGYGVLFHVFQNGFGLWDLDAEWCKWFLTSLGGALYLHWLLVLKRNPRQQPLRMLEFLVLLFVFSSMGFPWYLLAVLPWLLIQGHWLWVVFVALSQLIFYSHQVQISSAAMTGIAVLVLLLAVYQQKVLTEGEKHD